MVSLSNHERPFDRIRTNGNKEGESRGFSSMLGFSPTWGSKSTHQGGLVGQDSRDAAKQI